MSKLTKQQLEDRNAELVRQVNVLFNDSTLLKGLRKLLGYVQNGSSTTVTLSQDDATSDYCVTVGKKTYYASSFNGAIQDAINDNPEEF